MGYKEEQRKKQIGMDFAATRNTSLLEEFRTIALSIDKPMVDIDDVRGWADAMAIPFAPGNWMGSVFTSKEWEWTGRVRASNHPGSHGRMIKVWRKKNAGSSKA